MAKSIPLKLNGAKLPILITTYPEEDSYVLMLEYDRTRYSAKDMDTLLSCVANAAESMAGAERIRDISFLSDEEHEATLALCAGEKLDFDRTKTWLSMFAHWVQVQPDHTAVTDSVGELEDSVVHCLDEMMMNTVEHSGRGKGSYMDLSLMIRDGKVVSCLRNNGKPFDPLQLDEKERKLGLKIVFHYCTKLEYRYSFGQNIVLISRDLAAAA